MSSNSNSGLNKFFKINEHKTTVKTEIIAGITTFVTMAYILAVNPDILSAAGMDKGAVFTATAIVSIVGTLLMGFFANIPFALSCGMGINAFFSFTIVAVMGYSWQFAMTAVFIEGIIFVILSLLKVREYIVNSIPSVVKTAVGCGIGLFIAFIGLRGTGIIIKDEATLVRLGSFREPAAIVCIIGIFVILALTLLNVKGAMLIGIAVSTIVGIPLGVTKLPDSIVSLPPSMAPTAFAFKEFSFSQIFSKEMFYLVAILVLINMFATIGAIVGTATKAGMISEDGKVKNASRALLADAVGTTLAGLLGATEVTTFVESSAGVAEGGRTGLTSVTTGLLFVLALFLSPIFLFIPVAATSSVLIIVGLFMFTTVAFINFNDFTEGFPAFIIIILIPLSGSIGDGLMIGIISYA